MRKSMKGLLWKSMGLFVVDLVLAGSAAQAVDNVCVGDYDTCANNTCDGYSYPNCTVSTSYDDIYRSPLQCVDCNNDGIKHYEGYDEEIFNCTVSCPSGFTTSGQCTTVNTYTTYRCS
jgi:hypothetical protein